MEGFQPFGKISCQDRGFADRRWVALAARRDWLPVVHINPERYDEGDLIIIQEIGGAYDCDYFLKATASELVD